MDVSGSNHFKGKNKKYFKVPNGYHVDISCCRESKVCHRFGRPAREYIDINEEVCKEIKSAKIEVSDDLLLNVARLINHHCEEGTCASLHKFFFPLSVYVFMLIMGTFITGSVLVCINSGLVSSQLISTSIYMEVVICVEIPMVLGLVMVISRVCQRKIRTYGIAHLRVELFEKITSKSYTNNVLLSLGEHQTSCQDTLFLRILHYNVLACERHVIARLKADIMYKYREDVETIAKEIVVNLLKTWLTSGLADINQCFDAAETRHRVKGGKKCICQVLEDEVDRPRGFDNIVIAIDVT